MPTLPLIENVDVSILNHTSLEAQGIKACTLTVNLPFDLQDVGHAPTGTRDGNDLAAASAAAAAPTPPDVRALKPPVTNEPARLRFTVSSAELAQPLELLVSIDCGASFPPDGTVVLPLGSTAQDARTAVLRARDGPAAGRLPAEFRRILSQVKNLFDAKTEASSSHMYFHYYGMLQHQQNMLQDMTRTGTYYWAIMSNRQDFEGKVVVDVGAGTGILSLFAAQAGARKVYAIEASKMVTFAQKLFDSNGEVGSRIEILHGKVEALLDTLPEKADLLISEPMGTLLVNERMLETYILARKHMLKPGGLMFPSVGRVFVAAFSDAVLYQELQGMAAFWLNNSFYGVNLTCLHGDALEGYCGKVVIDSFDPGLLMSATTCLPIDFSGADEEDLQDIHMPLSFTCKGPCTIHGVACWFDVKFPGTAQPMWLSTAPGMAATHWFQLRCVLQTPLHLSADGQCVSGSMRLKAHSAQSYDIHLSLSTQSQPSAAGNDMETSVTSSGVFDLKDPYYRQLRATYQPAAAE